MPAFDTDGELTLPESPDSVSIITVRAYVPGGEMQVALVNRKFLKFSKNKIPENIDKHGVYVLLSNIGSNGHYKAYAGRSSKRSHGGMMQRLKDHSKKKDWWTRAILFTTKNEDLTTSSIERAEDDLIKKLETMKYVEMDNDEPGAKLNLSTRDEKVVERVLEIVLSVLWIYGYNTETGEKMPSASSTSTTESISASTPRLEPSSQPKLPPSHGKPSSAKGASQSSTSASPTSKGGAQKKNAIILELIDKGYLKVGEELYPNHKLSKQGGYTALLTTDGEIKPMGPGFSGETYSSLSTAGAAILRQIGRPSTCNGWEFWTHKLSDGSFEKLTEVRKRSKQQPEKQQLETKNPDDKVTPLDLINGGLLGIGERLYPGRRIPRERGYTAVLTADGKIRPDGPGFFGETYSSLSGAGEAVVNKITKVKSVGGWEFWMRKRSDGSFEKLTKVRERFLEQNR